MKRLATFLVVLATALVCPGVIQAQTYTNVTAAVPIQSALEASTQFWYGEHHAEPTLRPNCPSGVQVVLKEEMTAAANPDGSDPLEAGLVWAETVVGGCTINISPSMWKAFNEQSWTGWPEEACKTTVHEYGHVLGLWDTLIPGEIMDQDAGQEGLVPPCEGQRGAIPVVVAVEAPAKTVVHYHGHRRKHCHKHRAKPNKRHRAKRTT